MLNTTFIGGADTAPLPTVPIPLCPERRPVPVHDGWLPRRACRLRNWDSRWQPAGNPVVNTHRRVVRSRSLFTEPLHRFVAQFGGFAAGLSARKSLRSKRHQQP